MIIRLLILLWTNGEGLPSLFNWGDNENVRKGPVDDGKDDASGAWIIFGVLVVVTIVAGVAGYFWYQSLPVE